MSDYTKVNLREIDDAAAAHGVEHMEARFAREELGCTAGAVSLQRLHPNTRAPWGHRHERQEELYVILSGTGRMKLDDDIVEVGPLDAIRVAAGTMRAVEAGPDGLELLAYGAPIGGERDAELVPGWWD